MKKKIMKNYKIISENPFRTLGLFANATTKDIVAKRNQNMAFLSIGQKGCPLFDSAEILPEQEITTETITEAYSMLSSIDDRLKYAQFWFIHTGPIDDTAFQYLSKGDIQNAILTWETRDNLGSLQNRMLCHLLSGDIAKAVTTAEALYTEFGRHYMDRVLHEKLCFYSTIHLIRRFITTIIEEVAPLEILRLCHANEWVEPLRNICANDILSKLDIEIRQYDNLNKEDANANRQAAVQLKENASPQLSLLKEILPAGDLRYSNMADKVGLCLLSYCMDYFNKSTINIPSRLAAIRPIVDYAQETVQSEWAVSTCNEVRDRLFRNVPVIPLPPPPPPKRKRTIDKVTVIKYLLATAILSINLFFSIRTGLRHGFWDGVLLFVEIYAAYFIFACSVIFIISRISK